MKIKVNDRIRYMNLLNFLAFLQSYSAPRRDDSRVKALSMVGVAPRNIY